MNRLPEKLVLLRKHFGYTQQECAKMLNIEVNEYMSLENGANICDFHQLQQLADIFKVNVEELLVNKLDVTLPKIEVKKKKKENKAKDDKKWRMVAALGMFIIIVGIFGFIFFKDKMTPAVIDEEEPFADLIISKYDRLAAVDKYTVYINDDGSVKTMGAAPLLSEFTNIAKLSAYSDFIVGLKRDGTVVVANDEDRFDVRSWKRIVDIAAGEDHLVGLQDNGIVKCIGTDKACDVSTWTDIAHVAAGNNVTFGIKKNGEVVIAGDIAKKYEMMEEKDVTGVFVGENYVAFLHQPLTVSVYSLNDQEPPVTSDWKDIVDVVVGDNYIIGLDKYGKTWVSSEDENIKTVASKWENVSCIDGNKLYLVAYTDKVIGVGDNTYDQFSLPPVTFDQLATIENVNVEIDEQQVKFSWDPVENADYYHIVIEGANNIDVKSDAASLNLNVDEFKNKQQYSFKITAVYAQDEQYNSEEYIQVFTYTKAVPKHKLIIRYIFEEGQNEAAATYEAEFEEQQEYSVVSPVIDKYIADRLTVNGAMGNADQEIIVIYKVDVNTIVDPTVAPEAELSESDCLDQGGTYSNGSCTINKGDANG